MCSIDCLLCRLVQKVFLILATVKGRIKFRILRLSEQSFLWFFNFEILFPEVILRCKLPPSKSTIWSSHKNQKSSLTTTQGQDHAGLLTTLCTLYLYTQKTVQSSRAWRLIQPIPLWNLFLKSFVIIIVLEDDNSTLRGSYFLPTSLWSIALTNQD